MIRTRTPFAIIIIYLVLFKFPSVVLIEVFVANSVANSCGNIQEMQNYIA
jgi:hypothetical protein